MYKGFVYRTLPVKLQKLDLNGSPVHGTSTVFQIVIMLYIYVSFWLCCLKNDDNGLMTIRNGKEHREVYP